MFLLNARLYQLPARLMIKINSRSQIQCSSLHPSVLATSVQAFLLSWWIFWIPWWHPSRSPNLCGAYQEPDIGAAHTHKALQLPVSKKGRGKSLSIRKKHKKRIKKIESTTFYVFSTYSKFFWTLPQFFFYCSSTTPPTFVYQPYSIWNWVCSYSLKECMQLQSKERSTQDWRVCTTWAPWGSSIGK